MSQRLLIDGSSSEQTQFALIGENGLDDFEYESKLKKNQKGNIYLGKISRIEASLQAAFVEIGNEKNAFLAFGEIHPNYFQIPVADRDALIAAEAEIETSHNHYNNDTEFKDIEKEGEKVDKGINGNIIESDDDEVKGNIAEDEDQGLGNQAGDRRMAAPSWECDEEVQAVVGPEQEGKLYREGSALP